MEQLKTAWRGVYREPWFYSVLLLTVSPLFPDYISFPLIIASLYCACRDAKQRGRRLSLGATGLLMAAYLGYMALSLLYTADFAGTFWTLIMWTSLFAAYLSAATVLTDRRRLRTALLCLTGAVGAVGAMTVGQYLLRVWGGLKMESGLWNWLDRWVYGVLRIPVSEIDFGDRVSGTFNNPNLLAAYLVMTIPFAIAYVLTGVRSKPKAFARIGLILAAYALGFSFSRGGYLALIAIGVILFCLFVRKKFVMTVLTVIYIVLLIPPVIGNRLMTAVPHNVHASADSVSAEADALPERIQAWGEDVAAEYRKDDSVHMRFVMWRKVLEEVGNHPLIGAGLGVQTTQQTLQAAGLTYKHSHNLFLEILAEGGLVSFAFFTAVLLLLAQRSMRLLRRHQRSAWLMGFAILGGCLALCVHGVFDFLLLTPRLLVTVMLLLGVSESAARVYLLVPVPELYPAEPLRRAHSPAAVRAYLTDSRTLDIRQQRELDFAAVVCYDFVRKANDRHFFRLGTHMGYVRGGGAASPALPAGREKGRM